MKTKTKKGVTTHVVNIVLAIIVIVVVAAVTFNFIPQTAEYLKGWICDTVGFCFNLQSDTAFVQAMRFSYERCALGCDKLRESDYTTLTHALGKSAQGLFCGSVPSEFRDKDNKICGLSAAQYPVVFTPSEEESAKVFEKSRLGGGHYAVDCVFLWDKRLAAGEGLQEKFNFWLLRDELLSGKTETDKCKGGSPALESFSLKNNKYYIYTDITDSRRNAALSPVTILFGIANPAFIWPKTAYWTVLNDKPTYFDFRPGDGYSTDVGVSDVGINLALDDKDTSIGQKFRLHVTKWDGSTEDGLVWIKSFNTGLSPTCVPRGAVINVTFGGSSKIYRGCLDLRVIHGDMYISLENRLGEKVKMSLSYNPSELSAIFYQNANMDDGAGRLKIDVTSKTVEIPDLAPPPNPFNDKLSGFEKKISSVRIGKLTRVTLYSEKNFGGEQLVLTSETPSSQLLDLSKVEGPCNKFLLKVRGDWNDCAQSLKVSSTQTLAFCALKTNEPRFCPFTDNKETCEKQVGCKLEFFAAQQGGTSPRDAGNYCSGTPKACSLFTDDQSCNSQAACEWVEIT